MTKHQQNKKIKIVLLALLLGLSGTELFAQTISQGVVSNHAFTVNSSGNQVLFSRGNLQYKGSASTPYWKFAVPQWDYLGTTTGQNSTNSDVDRDLFGWGTSGYDHGAVCYQPWSTSQTESDYYAYGSDSYNLYDQTGQADWGYNAISNGGNTENLGWRTLTKDEWKYILNTRSTTSGIRYAKANVNNVNGVILLPDDWSSSYYTLNNTNSSDASFTSNTITALQWNTLEQHGVVFLPAADARIGTSDGNSFRYGYYWSASCKSGDMSNVYFSDVALYPQDNRPCFIGLSVRLVVPVENYSHGPFGINATPNQAEGGTVNGGGVYAMGTECTLTATPSSGYYFNNWTENGDVVSADATYTFTVFGERNLVANFAPTISQGAVSGHAFKVNADGDQVLFSQGNLQYIGSASTPYWKFADHQCDYLGTTTGQNSSDENVDRDLFGWGTSGYNHGAVCYQPWSTSETSTDYKVYGNANFNLYDRTGKADWGYNAIINGGNKENSGWRTLTIEEWEHLLNSRTTTSGILYAKANVNSINGIILLPDDWSSSYYTLSSTNTADAIFTSNTITALQWNTLEQHGAVFLPAAGGREEISVTSNGFGTYWSASLMAINSVWVRRVWFYGNGLDLGVDDVNGRSAGMSVRLVCPVEKYSYSINATPCPVEGGTVSGEGAYIGGADCTLTATPSVGYTFVNWMENNSVVSTNVSYNFNVYSDRNLVAKFVSTEGDITFADNNVKSVCVDPATGWDTNGDGELSYAEAAVVTSIGEVFKGKNTIESFNELQYFISLTSIDAQAFMGCSALEEITIPEYVTTIGNQAFMSCTALEEITIPEYVTTIGNFAFLGCSNLTNVQFNAINCTSMNTIYGEEKYSVFMSSPGSFPLTTLTIGDKVQNIPEGAFRGCDNILNLTIPSTVLTIGEKAFYQCTGLQTLSIGGGDIGQYAFYGCTGIETLTIGGGDIGQYAFNGCTSLETLTIGEGVTSIEGYAFQNCPALAAVNFNATHCLSMAYAPNNYGIKTSIVFDNSSANGVALNIGDNVTYIPEYAFARCSGFAGSLVIPNSVTTIGDFAFDGCGFTGSLVIPNSVTSIGRFAFASCTGFTGNLVIPNSVTTISDAAFYGCSGFTGLVIPNSVTSIGLEAFYRCTGFTGSLVIPNSVTSIGLEAFYRCTGFTGNLVISSSVTTIDEYAFYYCTGFTGSLVIPNSVTTIKKCAFYGCTGFNGLLVIGRGVNTIEQSAFYNCSGFTGVVSETATPPTAQSYSFGDMTSSIPVYVVVPSDYSNATGWSVFTNYNAQNVFNNLGSDNKWSSMLNWSSLSAPTSTQVVRIKENCALDTDADVRFVYIADDEKVLTVNEGKALNTTYGVHIEDAEQLVVGDGGQVKSNIPFCGTVQKHINAYTSNNDGWNFIASPITENQSISGLIPSGETVYDLYYLDEENTYWRNYKVNAFEINHNQGYLYGNQAGTTINFSGALQPYVEDGVSIPLTKEGDGWNLVGNPFTFNAYADKPYYVINGRNVEAAASGAIAPCTGIVVKAEGTANETVKFTKDDPVTSSAPSNGSLQIVLDEANTRGASTGSATAIDNAIVSFNEGTTLPKFRFGDNAQIYFPQNGEDYAIACAAKTGELPLNFKATKNGEYTLTVNPEGVEMNYLHLIDNMTGADVDLLQTSDYTFNAKTTDYASRFRLVFSANSVDENGASTGSAAFAYINNGNIVITDIADTCDVSLQVIDVTGRVVVSVGGHTRCVPTTGMTPGVYVLRLINGNDVKTQKMVIR